MKTVSLVIPVYAEAESLPALFDELRAVEAQLAARTCALELIFVDDGSRDGSLNLLLQFRETHPATKIVKLARNFGAVAASKAGLGFVTGGCFAWLSADLQDPPALIVEMVDAWLGGAKYVIAARTARRDPPLPRFFSALYYALLRRLVMPDYPQGGFDLALIDQSLMAHLRDSGRQTNTELLSFWLGVAPVIINYERRQRLHGKSGWTFARKLGYARDSLLGFSPFLIRAISLIGALVTVLSVCYGASAVLTGAPGFAAAFAVVIFLLGVIIFALGILGEYLWRIHNQLSQRPEVVIDHIYE
ncbi:MAG: glycosyltransferase family 2 protein [Chloroflexota bacterium]